MAPTGRGGGFRYGQASDLAGKPETEGAIEDLFNQFQRYRVSADKNPIETLHELETISELINECGDAHLPDRFFFSSFINALPPECEIATENLSSNERLTRSDVIRVVGNRYTNSCNKKAVKGPRGPAQQVFLAGAGGRENHRQSNNGRNGEGRGRGKGGGKGEGDARRCYRCNRKGHVEQAAPRQRPISSRHAATFRGSVTPRTSALDGGAGTSDGTAWIECIGDAGRGTRGVSKDTRSLGAR